MAAGISSPRKIEINGFMDVLSSASCEWFLMFLLYVDAAFWYLLLKFARYCELETPCLLCSRLDHGLEKKKHALCWSLLCSEHREEISSLVSCSVHSRFATVHRMCDECLTSIAMQKKSSSPVNMTCSCCSIMVKSKSNTGRLLQLDPLGFGASRENIRLPQPHTPTSINFSHSDSLKRIREKYAGTVVTDQPAQGNSVDADTRSATVAYTKLKLSSDSESEFAHSEDDDDVNTDIDKSLHEPPSDSDALKGPTGQGFDVKYIALDPPSMIKTSEHKNEDTLSSNANTEHFADLDKEEVSYCKRSSSLTRKLTSSCDSFSPRDGGVGYFTETSEYSISLPHLPPISVPSEVISVCSVAPLSNDTTPEKEDTGEFSENEEPSEACHAEATVRTNSDDTRLSKNNDTHHIDASIRGYETPQLLSRSAFEPTDTRDYAKIEDAAAVSTSDVGLLQEEPSHRVVHHKHDEFRITEDPYSKAVLFPASSQTEDSSYISVDEITVNDTEGESVVNQLQRQIEHDHNCLNSLYEELEEERNAASIAAEEAMAMITRLQEEKASLRMEALNYLRMMEEQATYDAQALEMATDLLAQREKELQDLEYELESYRNNFLDDPDEDDIEKTSDLDTQTAANTETSPGASSNS
ncbi:myosin-binding protein 1-like isoform X2 [Salvia splendens]|uniref:myosin-binding protein 1-like isoform X2 n=1 Tax=Salvia splendens TaxID=180675 RepID=UPI001C26B893|nr:myosin-binding protein 1-like isoform X2 [Salvia splendens]